MPRTLEGLGQPAKLHGKATPQIDNRIPSCKPRVSVSKVQVLKRQGLQTMAGPAGLRKAVLVVRLYGFRNSFRDVNIIPHPCFNLQLKL